MTAPRCPRCGRPHTTQDTRVAGTRFGLGAQPYAYRADYPDAPTRPTREAAMQDMCDRHTQQDETKESQR